ncbi:hypothetical protein MHF_0639 [Mycoplasma haemofelis Ohio2]|uniref:Uncharacterized protein n=1 Tax=Mycoplasma haemofelis (strain Ohio2) TaxID=859194 RepID=F6FI63_MYCHI|nr:hypothetical protein MHF_0639 [Mycoplasma haemofelis Ohio2]
MAISKPWALGGLGVASTGAIGGGLLLGKDIFSSEGSPKNLISKSLELSLMGFEDESLSSKWDERKTKLSSSEDSSLIPSLKAIKDKGDKTGEDIKNWCKENVVGFVEDDGGKKLQNVSDYCTFNIKDKISGTLVNGVWGTANDKLKKVGSGLSEEMKKVKGDLEKLNEDNNALKNWCESTYKKMFLGDEDQAFKDASIYCVSDN